MICSKLAMMDCCESTSLLLYDFLLAIGTSVPSYATGERLKSKGMVGPTRCPSCEREGKISSSPYPIPERAKSILGF